MVPVEDYPCYSPGGGHIGRPGFPRQGPGPAAGCVNRRPDRAGPCC